MFRSCKWAAGLAALTVAGVMMTATPALAVGPGVYYVRGYGWGYDTWGRPYFNRGWDGFNGVGLESGNSNSSYYYPSMPLPPTAPSTSYYYNPSSYAANQSMSAMIDVQVPANAKVWFDGTPTQQTGATRAFVSPPLDANSTYSYTVRAQWDDNGKMKEETRRVEVRAGQTSTVDFTRPASQ